MNLHLKSFAVWTLISLIVFAVLAFTPLSLLPRFLTLVQDSWTLFYGLLVAFFGVPFGGYVFLLIMSERGERIRSLASLTGFWMGAFLGSFLGVWLAGDL